MSMDIKKVVFEKIGKWKVCPYCYSDYCHADTIWMDEADREMNGYDFMVHADCCQCGTRFIFKIKNDCQGPEVVVDIKEAIITNAFSKHITWSQLSDMFKILNIG